VLLAGDEVVNIKTLGQAFIRKFSDDVENVCSSILAFGLPTFYDYPRNIQKQCIRALEERFHWLTMCTTFGEHACHMSKRIAIHVVKYQSGKVQS
jgi:hypothetical protein